MENTAEASDQKMFEAACAAAGELSSVLGGSMPSSDLFPGYDLIRQLGRGGQGVVYEAVQRATKRRVAIKAIRSGPFVTPRERARFQREVEFAARLQHPNIVSVLDSGIHQGHDFFVMEYVEGAPIDRAEVPGQCRVRETLALIAAVCDVVDYAHQHGVLHRDLKPSNVLIDERRQPHVLDFGLAKAMDPTAGSSAGMSISEPGQILGTLGYMSPEQSRGQFEQMSVRSDVYSLGAMSYQLLTGALPCRLDGGLNDVLERIAHQDPARPSSIRRKLDADVDAILLKALEKTPTSRYATAGEFAADIRRFLADEPIQARRIGFPTRIVRWTRRHRAVSTVSFVAVAVILSISITSFLRMRADAIRYKLVSEFLGGTIALFDPDKAGDQGRLELKKALDNRAQIVGEMLRGNPSAEADARNALGEGYTKLSLYPQAEEQFRSALAIRTRLHGETNVEVAQTQRNLAFALKQMNKLDEAEKLYVQEIATLRKLLDPDDDQIAFDLTYLSGLLRAKGQHVEALAVLNESLKIRENKVPQDARKVAIVKNMIGLIHLDAGDYVKAELFFRDVLVVYRRELTDTEPVRVATALNNLAESLRAQDKLDEARALCREGLEIRQRILPADHFEIGGSLLILGRIEIQSGDLAAAEEHLRRSLEIHKAKLPDKHPNTGTAKSMLGECLALQGKFGEAEPLLVEGYETINATRGPRYPGTPDALRRVIACYTNGGQPHLAAQYKAKLEEIAAAK